MSSRWLWIFLGGFLLDTLVLEVGGRSGFLAYALGEVTRRGELYYCVQAGMK